MVECQICLQVQSSWICNWLYQHKRQRLLVTMALEKGLTEDVVESDRNNSLASSLGSMSQMDESIREAIQETKSTLCSATPLTPVGKRKQMIKMLTLTLMPIIVLTALAISGLIATLTKSIDAIEIRRNVRFSRQVRIQHSRTSQ